MRPMPAKIERPTPQVTTNPRSASVSRPKDAAPVAQVAATPTREVPLAEYTGQAGPAKALLPSAQQVSTSADPSALWGAPPPAAGELTREQFAALSPADQATQLQATRAERDLVEKEIATIVERLDKKWNHSRLTTRTGALKHYEREGRHLGGGRRRQLRELVAKSETAQKKIDELKARAAALPDTPEAKKELAALRSEIARELRKARAEQSAAVKAATELVDQEGLKVDRLAVTEQVIDPSAPKSGSGGSLLDKIARFFKLDSLCAMFFDVLKVTVDNNRKQAETAKEAQKAEVDARREQRRFDERLFTELRTQEADAQARLASLVAQLRPAS